MALIKCPECGKKISDKAKACIHCGCPIQELEEGQTFALSNNSENKVDNAKVKTIRNRIIGVCLLTIVVIGCLMYKPKKIK